MTSQLVGMLANDIINSLDVKTKQNVMEAPTSNSEAYEYYLRGKNKFEQRKSEDDIEIVRGLIQKAIAFDDNLIDAKNLLGYTYKKTNNNDKALEIYNQT